MSDVNDFLASGILEMYVMGNTSPEESTRVEEMAGMYEEVKQELIVIEETLIRYAQEQAIPPDPTIKPFVMAMVDYMERLGSGESPAFPPILTEDSRIADYAQWLDREDFKLTGPVHEIHARIISYTPELTTAIVWLEHGAPAEVHKNEIEKFLIVEGTCNIIVENQDNYLSPGDFFSIPLHLNHKVIVTSNHPCKIVLQRIAA